MKLVKRILITTILCGFLILTDQNLPCQNYPRMPHFSYSCMYIRDYKIQNLKTGENLINHTSSNCNIRDAGKNFTIDVEVGDTLSVSFYGGIYLNFPYGMNTKTWVDFNIDYDWLDDGELILQTSQSKAAWHSSTFTIPEFSIGKNFRLRTVGIWDKYGTPNFTGELVGYGDCSDITIKVKPDPSPVAICKDEITVVLDESGSAEITPEDIDNGSTDNLGIVEMRLSKSKFDCSNIGINPIKFIVIDKYGNSDTCISTVNVIDNILPSITVSVSPDTLWPPNHEMVLISADINIDDNCPGKKFVLQSISSNEQDEGLDNDDLPLDIQEANFETDDKFFYLRNERDENGVGRVYTIIYKAVDVNMNENSYSVQVIVPLKEINLIIHPNPIKDVLYIDFHSLLETSLEVKIYNILGTNIFSSLHENLYSKKINIDMSRFAIGSYLLIIKINDQFKSYMIQKY